jgi:hypothetical protein
MDGGRTPLLRGFQTNTVNFNAPNNWVADSSKNLQNPFGNNIYTILNIICIHIYDYTYIYIYMLDVRCHLLQQALFFSAGAWGG